MKSETSLLLEALKAIYRAKGILYKDVAQALGVSESSVKRYLAGRGTSLALLERLCGIAGIAIADLVAAARSQEDPRLSSLSEEQEEDLSRHLFTAFLFYLLRSGWEVAEIAGEFALSQADLVLHLRRLERIGVIDLLPGNRVRLLTVPSVAWQPGGPIRRTFDRSVRQAFEAMNYHSGAAAWELETVKLSPDSIRQLRELIGSFSNAVRLLAAQDRAVRADDRPERRWYSVLVAAQPVDPAALAGGELKRAP